MGKQLPKDEIEDLRGPNTLRAVVGVQSGAMLTRKAGKQKAEVQFEKKGSFTQSRKGAKKAGQRESISTL
jgi:hypothetical protein